MKSLGKFIVFEGIDGSGTTTQAKLLFDAQTNFGQKVLLTCEPTKSSLLGDEIRNRLRNEETFNSPLLSKSLALLFAADRLDHINNEIIPALKANDFVISDRYVTSSIVYQGLNVDSEWVQEINKYAIKPTLTILLDIDEEIAIERIKKRSLVTDIYEKKSLLKKVREQYKKIASNSKDFIILDASLEQHTLHEKILTIVRELSCN